MVDIEPLTAAAFAAFGEVIEARPDAQRYAINEGYAERFHALAHADTAAAGGQALVSIFRSRARPFPLHVTRVERHLLGSQAFIPLNGQRFLVVVAAPGPAPSASQLRCFLARPGQGVNYHRGTWHSPLLGIDVGGDFLVIDRGGPQAAAPDCEEHDLGEGLVLQQV